MKAAQEGALEGMDTRIGKTGRVRLVVVALVALSLMLVAAFAVAPKADAHQTAGRTLVYLDGELVKNTRDDHFTFERVLSAGCHTAEVVYKRDGEVISRTEHRSCKDNPYRLTVKVDHSAVSFKTVERNDSA